MVYEEPHAGASLSEAIWKKKSDIVMGFLRKEVSGENIGQPQTTCYDCFGH